MKVDGIDVSTWQGDIDWNKVKAAGYKYAIIRAGFGNSATQKDKKFDAHMNGALNAGLDVGAYWFSYAYTPDMARDEARVFLEVMKPYWGKVTYPLYFDWEGDSWRYSTQNGVNPNKALITAMCEAFCNEIEKGDYYAGNYTNQDYYKNYFDYPMLSKYTVWLADYYGEASYPCDMQQYTSSGSVNGISGNVDCNYCFRDFPTEIANRGMQGLKAPQKPQPPVENKPSDECAEKDKKIEELGALVNDWQLKCKQRDQEIRGLNNKVDMLDNNLDKLKSENADLKGQLQAGNGPLLDKLAAKEKEVKELNEKLNQIKDIL